MRERERERERERYVEATSMVLQLAVDNMGTTTTNATLTTFGNSNTSRGTVSRTSTAGSHTDSGPRTRGGDTWPSRRAPHGSMLPTGVAAAVPGRGGDDGAVGMVQHVCAHTRARAHAHKPKLRREAAVLSVYGSHDNLLASQR